MATQPTGHCVANTQILLRLQQRTGQFSHNFESLASHQLQPIEILTNVAAFRAIKEHAHPTPKIYEYSQPHTLQQDQNQSGGNLKKVC